MNDNNDSDMDIDVDVDIDDLHRGVDSVNEWSERSERSESDDDDTHDDTNDEQNIMQQRDNSKRKRDGEGEGEGEGEQQQQPNRQQRGSRGHVSARDDDDDDDVDVTRDNEDIAETADDNALDPMAAAQLLRQRWLRSGRNISQLFKDEFDTNIDDISKLIDITGVRLRFQQCMEELFEVESELARCDDKSATATYMQVGKANAIDGDLQSDFDTIRQKLFFLLNIAENSTGIHAIEAGANCASLGRNNRDLIRTFRSNRGTLTLNTRADRFFLELAHQRNMRKIKVEGVKETYMLYTPRVIDGYKTVTFDQSGTILEWMNEQCSDHAYPDIFAIMNAKATTIPTVQRFLENTPDPRLPPYVVTEAAHGFVNAYVLVKTGEVHFYEDAPTGIEKVVAAHHHEYSLQREWFAPTTARNPRCTRQVTFPGDNSRFWLFTQTHLDGTQHDVLYPLPASAKGSFAKPPPLDIDMPAMQQVLHFQDFTPEMQVWLYAMLGRLMLYAGSRDQFSVILLLSGVTQSGKSTILDAAIAALFPNKERISVLSSNKEGTFGLQASYDKDCLVCDEMEQRPNWNQGEIKSMATGGYMAIARKNRDAVSTRWKPPVVLSSNYLVPQWGGNDVYALVRRFAPFVFPHTVANPDEAIKQQLHVEMPRLFATCMLSYHWIINNVGQTAFNKIGPAPCLRRLKDMLADLHPLVAFLEQSDSLVFAPAGCNEETRRSVYMPFTDFKNLFDEWVKIRRIKNDSQWKSEFYSAPLAGANCTVGESLQVKDYPRADGEDGAIINKKSQLYLYGVDRRRL